MALPSCNEDTKQKEGQSSTGAILIGDRIYIILGKPAEVQDFSGLDKTTLSVVPDEAYIAFPSTLNSSAQTIGMIYSLPEREMEKSYPGLIFLGNSSLELKKLGQVAF